MCVVCALCVSVLLHSRTSALAHLVDTPCRRLRAVTKGFMGPPHPVYRAAPSVLSVWCCTAWCYALHRTVCALPYCCCEQRAVGIVTHCHATWGPWAVEIPLRTASLPEGSWEWYFCRTLPPGSGPPATHCPRAWGQWAAQPLQYTAPVPGGRGQWISCNALPNCQGAVGSGPPAIQCLTAWGQRAVDLLQHTAPLPEGSGQWTSCYTLPHCPVAVGSGPPAMQCLTAWGAVGSGPPAIHCLTALGQWAVDLLQNTGPLPGGSGPGTCCNTPPHCLGAVGSGPPSMHCLPTWG